MCLTTLKYKQHYIKRSVRIIKINNYRLMNQKQRQDTTKKEFITKLHSCKKRKNSIDAHLRLVGVLSTMYAGRRDLFSYLYFLLFRHSNFPTHPQCLHFISSLPCFLSVHVFMACFFCYASFFSYWRWKNSQSILWTEINTINGYFDWNKYHPKMTIFD